MRDPTLLLPFALPPTEHAKDLIASLNTPALATLIARATERPVLRFDTFAAALPHEMIQYACSPDRSPPIAHQRMQQLGVAAKSGFWFMLQPVHLHVARDHLVLTDVRQLPIDEQTSKKLFESTAPLFDELGYELRFGDTGHWFMRADAWHTLRTTTPDAAAGHNVDVWLPSGEHARAWRKLHNEVQMLWHSHPVNEAREAHGQPRINALWLWGGADANQSATPNSALKMDESLIPHALADDWGRWLLAMQEIEREHCVPLIQQLQTKAIDSLTLQLSDAHIIRQWRITSLMLKKFWRKPSLARLLNLP